MKSKLMKYYILALLFLQSFTILKSQSDTSMLIYKEVFEMEFIDSRVECRVNYTTDSLLHAAVLHDVTFNLYNQYPIYYRIGNIGNIDEYQKIAIEKYNLNLIYTYCVYCRYQKEYNKYFSKMYFEKTGKKIENIISEIENVKSKKKDHH